MVKVELGRMRKRRESRGKGRMKNGEKKKGRWETRANLMVGGGLCQKYGEMIDSDL